MLMLTDGHGDDAETTMTRTTTTRTTTMMTTILLARTAARADVEAKKIARPPGAGHQYLPCHTRRLFSEWRIAWRKIGKSRYSL